MRSWSTLPHELLSYIFESLEVDFLASKAQIDQLSWRQTYRWDRTRRTALPPHIVKHVSLVNKHWHAAANENLYRTVFVHREATIQLLVKAVKSNPDLLYLIKSVTIDFKYNGLPTQPKALKKALGIRKKNSKLTWELLQMLRPGRLVYLEIECSSLEISTIQDSIDVMIPSLRGLVHLTLKSTRGSHYWRNLRQWIEPAKSSLTRLSLLNISLSNEDIPTGMLLRNLRIDVNGAIDVKQLQPLLCKETLEALSLTFSAYYPSDMLSTVWEPLLLQVAPKLQAFRLLSQWRYLRHGQELAAMFCKVLDKANSLRILHLILEDVATVVPNYLPRSLHRLLLHICPADIGHSTDCAVMLQAATAVLDSGLPFLTHLTIVSRMDSHDLIMEGPEVDKVIAAGTAKGVFVQFLLKMPTEDWSE